MDRHFALSIRLHDRRYHGAGAWPPAPARAFQALVAGVARGRRIPDAALGALRRLERSGPPIVAAPIARPGSRVSLYVPNNDADSLADPRDPSTIRTKKAVLPRLLESDEPFLYAWRMGDDDDAFAGALSGIATQLYQFGRGVDMAWAVGEVLRGESLEDRLRSYRGTVHRPGTGEGGIELACPGPSSLESLERRFAAAALRLRPAGGGKGLLFVQPPKPLFVQVRYDSAPERRVYELQAIHDDSVLHQWRYDEVVALVEQVRDLAADRLRGALPHLSDEVERVLVGRKRDGGDAGPIQHRVRIVPLPSIGHRYADRGIRRLLVEVPGGPLSPADVLWAFSGLELTGASCVLASAEEATMLDHFDSASRQWRTVTPMALPDATRRRRIGPERRREEAKPAAERTAEEERASAAVVTVLRQAGVRARPCRIVVQREPFEAKGLRAERFAPGTRFSKEQLWHVELTFEAPVGGPLVVGDGRFLGLGILAPVRATTGVHAFRLLGVAPSADHAEALARSLRRAVMSRIQDELGARVSLPAYFSGHAVDGGPVRRENEGHLVFSYDPVRGRLLVIAPHILERRRASASEARHLEALERALTMVAKLRAGTAGLFDLVPEPVDVVGDPLFAPSRRWTTLLDYRVTRHVHANRASEAVAQDVLAECRRHDLPSPVVTVRRWDGRPGAGLRASVTLDFRRAVPGPILLGRTRHLGGGLFGADPER